jgi:hypothetical protein
MIMSSLIFVFARRSALSFYAYRQPVVKGDRAASFGGQYSAVLALGYFDHAAANVASFQKRVSHFFALLGPRPLVLLLDRLLRQRAIAWHPFARML